MFLVDGDLADDRIVGPRPVKNQKRAIVVCSAVRLALCDAADLANFVQIPGPGFRSQRGRRSGDGIATPLVITHGVIFERRGFDRYRGRYIDAGRGGGTIVFRCVAAVIGAQGDDPGGGLLAEFDALCLRLVLGDPGKRGRQRRIEVGLLVGVQRQQHVIGRGSRRGFPRGVPVCRELELVGRIAPVDGVDRLEHRDVEHRLAAGIGGVQELLFDARWRPPWRSSP